MNFQRPGTLRHWGWGTSAPALESSLAWPSLRVYEGGPSRRWCLKSSAWLVSCRLEAATALPLTSNLVLLSLGSLAP